MRNRTHWLQAFKEDNQTDVEVIEDNKTGDDFALLATEQSADSLVELHHTNSE